MVIAVGQEESKPLILPWAIKLLKEARENHLLNWDTAIEIERLLRYYEERYGKNSSRGSTGTGD